MVTNKPKHVNDFLDFIVRHGSTNGDIVIPCSDGEMVILSGIDIDDTLDNMTRNLSEDSSH